MAERTGPRKQSKGLTLWHAAIRSGDINRVRDLIEAGANIDAIDEHGQTGLMNAVYWGNFDIAKFLVDRRG